MHTLLRLVDGLQVFTSHIPLSPLFPFTFPLSHPRYVQLGLLRRDKLAEAAGVSIEEATIRLSNVKQAIDKHSTNEAARQREARAMAMARVRVGLDAAVAGVAAAVAAEAAEAEAAEAEAAEAEAMEADAAEAGAAEAGAAAAEAGAANSVDGDGGGETKSQEGGGCLGAEGEEAECLVDQVRRLEAENTALGAAVEKKDARINDLVASIAAMTMVGSKRSREG